MAQVVPLNWKGELRKLGWSARFGCVRPLVGQRRLAIFEFIEVWYNRQRLHSALGYLSPDQFERQFSMILP